MVFKGMACLSIESQSGFGSLKKTVEICVEFVYGVALLGNTTRGLAGPAHPEILNREVFLWGTYILYYPRQNGL